MKRIILPITLLFFLSGCMMGSMEKIINKKEYKLSTNHKITIGFDNGSVFGSSGVNRYIGSYSIKDGNISFGHFGMTMMMGPVEDMDNETKYLQGLQGELPVKIDEDNRLVIGDYIFIPQNK